jgi:hypothetical protein
MKMIETFDDNGVMEVMMRQRPQDSLPGAEWINTWGKETVSHSRLNVYTGWYDAMVCSARAVQPRSTRYGQATAAAATSSTAAV